jgi:glycosyltransferase involved in cell wall biosynthesis
MKYSVIIPAYNAVRFIREAVESVLLQNYSDWELIIINDGSTDNTLEVSKSLADSDPRIRVFDKKNEGVSAARNDGLLAGDYLFFLDADDKLGDEVMLRIAEALSLLNYQPDIVFGDYYRFDERSGFRMHYSFDYGSDLSEVTGKKIWNVLFGRRPVFVSPMMVQIYRTSFIKENKIFFDKSLSYAEDHDWRFLALQNSNRYYAPHFTTYYYREDNTLSATHLPMTFKRYSCQNKFCVKWFYKAKEEPKLACVKDVILSRLAEIYMSNATRISLIRDKQERDESWDLFRKSDRIMRYVRAKRHRLILQTYRVFGIAGLKLISHFCSSRSKRRSQNK